MKNYIFEKGVYEPGHLTYGHMGMRIIKPSVLRLMKEKRAESKDIQHIAMIDRIMTQSYTDSMAFKIDYPEVKD